MAEPKTQETLQLDCRVREPDVDRGWYLCICMMAAAVDEVNARNRTHVVISRGGWDGQLTLLVADERETGDGEKVMRERRETGRCASRSESV